MCFLQALTKERLYIWMQGVLEVKLYFKGSQIILVVDKILNMHENEEMIDTSLDT